jgi:hypothetical protein
LRATGTILDPVARDARFAGRRCFFYLSGL